MKKIIVLAYLLYITVGSSAQTTLTYKTNALLPDASVLTYEIDYTDPGLPGANQTWDFSKIKLNSGILLTTTKSITDNNQENIIKNNVILSENGFDYTYNYNDNTAELTGCSSPDVSLLYNNPLIKMKYPFSFGDNFKDEYSGSGIYMKLTELTFSGNANVTADGYGTLILPERTLNNVLRVKVVKYGLEKNPCSTIKSNQTYYYYYADGYRYPVVTLIYKVDQNTLEEPVITKRGYYNPLQLKSDDKHIATIDDISKTDFALFSYPNPFIENLNFSYYLKKSTNVTIDLYDVSGKLNVKVLNNQSQDEGIHTGNLDAVSLGLVRGVYYIRFTFDNKVFVHKIVKV
jgi:hypothetical protein